MATRIGVPGGIHDLEHLMAAALALNSWTVGRPRPASAQAQQRTRATATATAQALMS